MTAAMCLQCRVVQSPRGRCEGAGHVTIDLAVDRDALVRHVWGDLHQQVEALRRVVRSRVGALRSTALGVGVGLGVSAVFGLGLLPTAAVVTGASVALSRLGERRARRAPPEHPRGASPLPEVRPFARGRIRGAAEVSAPASGTQCAGWAIELRYEASFGSRVMLRAGATAGLELELDTGERARIGAGALRFVQQLPQLPDYSAAEVEEFLRRIDPGRSVVGELCPAIPFNVIGEEVLQVGDRVELYGAFEPAVVAGASAALYREAPATIWVPRGVSTLRRLR